MDTREMILEAAQAEFAALGIDGARVDKIAKTAGVNKAMIYYHFHSKEKLYEAVIEKHVKCIGDFWEKAMIEESDPEALIRRAAEYYHSMPPSVAGFVPIILREIATGGTIFRNTITKVMVERNLISKMRQMIEKGIADGKFRDMDSKQAMISFLGMNIFYLIMAPFMHKVWEIDDVEKFHRERPKQIADLYLYGLLRR
jgi:TetR/AcrR family transcriptional regulator